MRSARLCFVAWAIVVLALLIGFVKLMVGGLSLDTNLLDLLPHTHQNKSAQLASTRFIHTLSRQVVFLIQAPTPTDAQKAANAFNGVIANSRYLTHIQYRMSTKDQTAWASLYFPYRMNLLAPDTRKLLQSGHFKTLEANAIASLYSPMGAANAALLHTDPLFLFQHFMTQLPKPASHLSLVAGRLMVHHKGLWSVMIRAQTTHNGFSIHEQNAVIAVIHHAKATMLHAALHSQLLMTGVLFYAHAGTQTAQHDISTIGVGSLIGIILLVLLTFRSLRPLCLTLLSCAIGFMAAFVVAHLFFAKLYLFTLVFGMSLIGISVDYAFFYCADRLAGGASWNSTQGVRNILPGISLGLFNVVLAYIVIAFAPFPALKQLAVFSVTGLVMAFATVVCLFPVALTSTTKPFTPRLMRLTNAYLTLWQKVSATKVTFLYVAIAIISIVGLMRLHANDDIHILQSPPPALTAQETQIKALIGSTISAHFFVVTGKTPAQTLAHEALLTKVLRHTFGAHPYLAVSDYVPTAKAQRENYTQMHHEVLGQHLLAYLHKLGVSTHKAHEINAELTAMEFSPLTMEHWLASPASKTLRYLWLGNINHQSASVVLLSENLPDKALITISKHLPFAIYVNQAAQTSAIFKQYRILILRLLLLAYGILWLVLSLRYGLPKISMYFLPPLSACALSLAVLGLLGIPLTLFNVLALVLVLGISVDYVLFFAETKRDHGTTLLAVALSAITMALSFGLLALSQTPVIHDFGITILTGIVSAFLLAPLAARVKPNKRNGL
jgi:predicted exporter